MNEKYFLVQSDANRKVKHLLFRDGWDTEAEAQAYIDADDPSDTRPLSIVKMSSDGAKRVWHDSDATWFECDLCKDYIPLCQESEDNGFVCDDCEAKHAS